MSREAMKQALEALDSDNPDIQLRAAIALRQALEEKREPVCWTVADGWAYANDTSQVGTSKEVNWEPIYTASPKREWVELTDQEIHEIDGYEEDRKMYRFARAIESKLKEKNHG